MSQPIYFEDIELNAVRETHGRTITEADIVIHAGHTGDFFPHHMDAEFARTTPFDRRIAHGTLTFGFAVGLKAAIVNTASFTYGFDRLRFPKPVFIGDTLRVRVTVARKEEDPKRPSYGRYVERVEALNQRDEVVLAFDHIALAQRRPRG